MALQVTDNITEHDCVALQATHMNCYLLAKWERQDVCKHKAISFIVDGPGCGMVPIVTFGGKLDLDNLFGGSIK